MGGGGGGLLLQADGRGGAARSCSAYGMEPYAAPPVWSSPLHDIVNLSKRGLPLSSPHRYTHVTGTDRVSHAEQEAS